MLANAAVAVPRASPDAGIAGGSCADGSASGFRMTMAPPLATGAHTGRAGLPSPSVNSLVNL